MCGFAGFIDFTGKTSQDVLPLMFNEITHRGPDDSGMEYFKHNQTAIGFGFRRLSIIELSELGHQPMKSENGRLTIIFNGEIYNYKEIRKDLENAGYSLTSHSDTEVILKAYEKWGIECIHKFIGMFAIALYDRAKEKIFLIRDRAGVKPLFYYIKDGLILFGSELKSFHHHSSFKKEIDFDALSLYLQYGYIPAPYSIFKNTKKVTQGHYVEIDLASQKSEVKKYWDVVDLYNRPRLDISFNEATNELEKLLTSAFQYRMVADVPVGVFLSGGYDSSAVTAILQANSQKQIKTFTIGFGEPKFNEAEYAKDVAKHLRTDHTEYYCTYKEAIDIVPQLSYIYDEPFGDSSAIPTTLVSRIARKEVTVALSADGGDEIFAGYPRHNKFLKYYPFIKMWPPALLKFFGTIAKPVNLSFLNPGVPDRFDKLKHLMLEADDLKGFKTVIQSITFNETKRLIRQPIEKYNTPFDEGHLFDEHNDTLSKILATEYKTYMVDDILQKVDRATMSVSLEGREPFLDQRIVDFASELPSDFKLRDGKGKYILRKIVHKYIPEKLMDRPKMGFGVPVENWCKNELKDILRQYLDPVLMEKQGIFNANAVSRMVNAYLSGKKVDFQRIWFLLMFQMWYERWMEN